MIHNVYIYIYVTEWGSTTLCSAKGTLDCHSKWVLSRCRTPRPWLYSILTTRTFLMAWNGQTDETIRACTCCLQYEGGFLKAPLYPIMATAPLDLLHVDLQALRPCWSQTNHLELPTSWCSKTTSWNMCWHMWPLIKLQKPLPNFYMEVTSLSLGPQSGSWVIEVLASWVA